MFYNFILAQNTIKFCYSKVDEADMDLQGVKGHDVRVANYASLPLEIT